jgi:hypothetical protein
MAVKTGRICGSLLVKSLLAVFMPALALGMLPVPCMGSQPRLERLGAATRVGDTAPEGWSHLVLKSVPRLYSGDRDSLPKAANKTATMFRTVILADVQGLGLDKEFILSRVGIGICIPSRDGKGEDLVVSSDRLDALSLKLSTVEQMVLDAADTELAEARIIAFTSSFALLRAPVTLVVAGKHQKVDLFYAFCVDPTTGRLRVGAWSMWPGEVKQPPPPFVIDLEPKTIFDCKLNVQAKRVLGTVPYSWSFAMSDLPPGHSISIKGNKPLGEKIVAITKHPSDVDTAEFERMLRKVLFVPRDVDKGAQRAQASTKRRTPAR